MWRQVTAWWVGWMVGDRKLRKPLHFGLFYLWEARSVIYRERAEVEMRFVREGKIWKKGQEGGGRISFHH